MQDNIFEKELSYKTSEDEAINNFILKIGAKLLSKTEFIYNNEKWFIDYHIWSHSNDIIVEENIANNYDKFLLVKSGSDIVRIIGWCDKELLMKIPARDIYRNGTKHFVVIDTNVKNLTSFKLLREDVVLQKNFIINQQEAENLGSSEMISGLLAGFHYFAKKAGLFFKDINQKDEFILEDKKIKIYTRDYLSDEDMLITDGYFLSHPEIDYYVLCKIKGGKYNYLGYINKEIVQETRIVQMTGNADLGDTGEKIRRIFAEQYKPISDLIKLYEEIKKEELIIIPQSYVPLHQHSEWSIGDGYGTVKYIAEALKKQGFKSAALTDHGTLAGVLEFQKACLLQDIKPIIGCEFYTNLEELDGRFHLTILVKNKQGWENILKLQSLATREGFYYKPTIKISQLLKHNEGLIVLSGCSSGLISRFIENNNVEKAEELIINLKEVFKEDFYLEIQPHCIGKNQEIMETLYNLSLKHNLKCVITTDSHYPYKEDKKIHDAIKAISLKKKYGEAGFGDDCFYLMQDKDIEERINEKCLWMKDLYKDFMKNTFEVSDKCDFKIEPVKEQDTLPKYIYNKELINKEYVLKFLEYLIKYKGEDLKDDKEKENFVDERTEFFITLAYTGLKRIKKDFDQKYVDRLNLELLRIIKKGYVNYFLIMWDMADFCRLKGILKGPGRGSCGASLVSYCMQITDVDPIEHDLLFDRFISSIRKDFVDIDMDYQDDKRDELFDYLINKYGETHSNKVATYARFHPKGILKDLGRIFDIPGWEINKVSSLVIERSGGDARASFGLTDTFEEFAEAKEFQKKYPLVSEIAMKLEGMIRHKSSHAAAIILTEQIDNYYAPINKIGGIFCYEWEKQLCEDMHLIKFDILGLKTLTIIKDAVNSANIKLPDKFEDPLVYEKVFKNMDAIGIFQLGTVGAMKFCSDLNISCFSDIYDANTIFRPSCLHAGTAAVYKNRKLGLEDSIPFHKSLIPITGKTQNVILFQEQIMQVMNQVAGLSWATAEMARKVITKSKGKDAFNKMRQDFVNGAQRVSGINVEEAEKLFDIVSTFGSYGFNKAHAVEYSILTYWQAWLKTYYPQYFYKALLKYETDQAEIKNYIQDAKKHNVTFEFPDINKSGYSYEIFDGKIYAGLSSIIGIGGKIAEKIILNRPYLSYEDFMKRCKVSDKILRGLIISDAFREFNINKKEKVLGFKSKTDKKQKCLFEDKTQCIIEDFDEVELSQLIYQHTTLQPNIDVGKSFNFGNLPFINISDLINNKDKRVILRGIITAVLKKDKLLRGDLKKHTLKFEQRLLYLNLTDGTDNVAIQINPETYELIADKIEFVKNKPVIVFGSSSKDGKKVFADVIDIVTGEHKTNNTEKIVNFDEEFEANEALIFSARPAVSKAGKSYYRVELSNGEKGLCFRFEDKLYPGMKIRYWKNQEPFINIKVLNNEG